MPMTRPTDSVELLDRMIHALSRRREQECEMPMLVTHLMQNDDLTFVIHLPDIGKVTITTARPYHDVLQGGRVRRWIGRRWFVEKQPLR